SCQNEAIEIKCFLLLRNKHSQKATHTADEVLTFIFCFMTRALKAHSLTIKNCTNFHDVFWMFVRQNLTEND
ncbi:MAG: hypothetical protein Q4G07_08625, partial [Oscillospiraceae bacterium]|nr:hypothetical protein [Oscillospiraceae bacterium]